MSSNRQQQTIISMREAEDYLDSTPRFTNKSSLENIRKYLARFGNPERGLSRPVCGKQASAPVSLFPLIFL